MNLPLPFAPIPNFPVGADAPGGPPLSPIPNSELRIPNFSVGAGALDGPSFVGPLA